MKKFSPLENIFFEEKIDWHEEDDQEHTCLVCRKHVEPQSGKKIRINSGDTYVHFACEKQYHIDPATGEVFEKLDDAPEEFGDFKQFSRLDDNTKVDSVIFTQASKRGIPAPHKESSQRQFFHKEYQYTKDLNWIATLVDWYIESPEVVDDHLIFVHSSFSPRARLVHSLKSLTGNKKGLRKYSHSYYFIMKMLAGRYAAIRDAKGRLCLGLEPELYFQLPNLYNELNSKSSADIALNKLGGGASSFKDQFSKTLETALLTSEQNNRKTYRNPSERGRPVDSKEFIELFKVFGRFGGEFLTDLDDYNLRNFINYDNDIFKKSPANSLLSIKFNIPSNVVSEIVNNQSDTDDADELLVKLWKTRGPQIQELFDDFQVYCPLCLEPATGTGYSSNFCESCSKYGGSKESIYKRFLEEYIISREMPQAKDLQNTKTLIQWIRKHKYSLKQETYKKNDRRAQRNQRWAVAKYPTEYFRGLRLTPLYVRVLEELRNRVEDNPEAILAIHGRDGEMIYELARVVDPKLFKKMVYFITSRPLTSDRKRGPQDETAKAAMVKHNNYITRILPKEQPAIHIDTGFSGSIPDWFADQGWDVKDIGLISTSLTTRQLFDDSGSSKMRKLVLDDLEHVPQRLAKIRDVTQWGNLKYSKHAAGFWARLYGLIVGYHSADRDRSGGPSGKRVSHNHGKQGGSTNRRKCWGCKAEKMLKTAMKHGRGKEFNSLMDFRRSKELEASSSEEQTWEDWE